MKKIIHYCNAFVVLHLLIMIFPYGAYSMNKCGGCHADLAGRKVIHAPVSNGFCFMCHDSVNPSQVPHQFTSSAKLGLSYEGKDLCFACHEESVLSRNPAHPSVEGVSCTLCHDPHASDNANLLR